MLNVLRRWRMRAGASALQKFCLDKVILLRHWCASGCVGRFIFLFACFDKLSKKSAAAGKAQELRKTHRTTVRECGRGLACQGVCAGTARRMIDVQTARLTARGPFGVNHRTSRGRDSKKRQSSSISSTTSMAVEQRQHQPLLVASPRGHHQ